MSPHENERTPLLRVEESHIHSNDEEALPMLRTPSRSGEETKSRFYVFMLVLGIGGLQLSWAIQMSNGSPYLQSLGISKALLSLVWVAGPLSGTLAQPYVGMKSDNCRSRWGRRKPFIWGGALATIVSIVLLSWAREIVQGVALVFGASAHSQAVSNATAVFAVITVYILDFAVNTIQAGLRCFIVDVAPAHQQEQASAGAGILTGVGNIFAYLAAQTDLPQYFSFLGWSQFQVLTALASLILCITIIASTTYISEPAFEQNEDEPRASKGLFVFFSEVFKTVKRMPTRIRNVCLIQFFHWIGWFPFLFYTTTYIGQLYVNPIFRNNPHLSKEDIEKCWEEGTRAGSFSLFIFAITSLASSLTLPLIVKSSYTAQEEAASTVDGSDEFAAVENSDTEGLDRPKFSSLRQRLRDAFLRPSSLLSAIKIRWLTLRRAWLLGQILFVLCMGITFFVETPRGATVLIGFLGISWSLTQWAPFALISMEIRRRKGDGDDDLNRHSTSLVSSNDAVVDEKVGTKAGIIMGIHNMAIASPQVVSILIGSLIFKIFEKPRGEADDDSTASVLRFGGLATLVAVFMTYKLKDPHETRRSSASHLE